MLLALDVDDAHATGTEAGELRLVAQRRDLDAVVAADLEDRLALEALDGPAVDLDPDPGVACGRCGAWVVISRSACVSSSGTSVSALMG